MGRSSHASLFFAGVLMTNSVPHFATAILGRRQITPFGRSSSAPANLVWAAINAALAYLLLRRAKWHTSRMDQTVSLLPLEAGCLFWGAWMTGFESLGIWLKAHGRK